MRRTLVSAIFLLLGSMLAFGQSDAAKDARDLSVHETLYSGAAKLQALPKSLHLPIRHLSSRNFPSYCGFTSSYDVSRFAGETEICDER